MADQHVATSTHHKALVHPSTHGLSLSLTLSPVGCLARPPPGSHAFLHPSLSPHLITTDHSPTQVLTHATGLVPSPLPHQSFSNGDKSGRVPASGTVHGRKTAPKRNDAFKIVWVSCSDVDEQSEESQKEKSKCHILMHMCGI